MELEKIEGYNFVDGGVCAAKGFTANGLNCGINPNKEKFDLGLIYSDHDCTAAGVYTQNKVKGAPVIVTRENLKKTGGHARAVIANSKNANTCNADGIEIAEKTCELIADVLGIKPEEVIIGSTGVIGQPMSIKPFEEYVKPLAEGLTADGSSRCESAIMTTDTVPKEVAVEFEIDGCKCHIGGIAKGSGMIHPNMATTLNFLTSDVAITPEMLEKALKENVKETYNCISVDGDQSTNDTCTVMANGLAGNTLIDKEDYAFETFKEGLYIVMLNLAKMLAADGEGATKLIVCKVNGADSKDTAITVAKSVICSSLFKCAIFGGDANWGRILCAIGYADADFDIDKVGVDMASKAGRITVCKDGAGVAFSEEEAAKILKEDEILIDVDLCQGECEATAYGCDLTYDYVKINGDYRS